MISILKCLALLGFGACLPLLVCGQPPAEVPAGVHMCGTDEAHAALMQDPGFRAQREWLENAVREHVAQNNPPRFQRTAEEMPYYVIPTVVHVVWGDPTASPFGRDSISAAQVMSNFKTLHEDFRNIPGTPGFTDRGLDYRVEFSLATIDPGGNPTTGINYVYNPTLADHNMSTESFTLKSSISWPRTRYLNVWLVNNISGGTQSGQVLGYAFFPQPGNQIFDGVVMMNRCWGTLGTVAGTSTDMGRVATHEFGHWLDLAHPFQSGCGSSNCAASGDEVCDTPPRGAEAFGVGNERLNTCNVETPDRPDNPRNYMDYLNDAAKNHFTRGQWVRTEAVMENDAIIQRFRLWQNSNLIATGAGPYQKPVAVFVADRRSTQAGYAIQFRDFSRGVPGVWEWLFDGGTPSASNDPNPLVAYNTPGTYDVRLVVHNLSGQPDTLLMPGFITVSPDLSVPPPLNETFDASPGLPGGWGVANTDSGLGTAFSFSWEIFEWPLGAGNRQAMLRNFSYSVFGNRDYLHMPPLNLSGVAEANLSFVVAYQPYRASELSFPVLFNDTLEVGYSLDGGLTWSRMFRRGGGQISYNGLSSNANNPFTVPGTNTWRRFTLCMDHVAGQPNVMLRFENINGFGGNLFIDSVSVEPVPAAGCLSGEEQSPANLLARAVTVAPNPFGNTTNLLISLLEPAEVRAEVLDATGRRVLELPAQPLPAGENALPLNLAQQPAGLYYVNLRLGNQHVAEKVLKH